MALPALLDGSDCGPVNPLRSLTKQFDTDRGIQQDFFGTGNASSSQQSFRTQAPQNSGLQEATRFFADEQTRQIPSPYHQSLSSFDLLSLRTNLPKVGNVQAFASESNLAGNSSWSSDFLNQMTSYRPNTETGSISELAQRQSVIQYQLGTSSALALRPHHMRSIPQWKSFDWEHSFPAEEPVTSNQADIIREQPVDADELSKTAALLIDAVKQESNPKFKNSSFLSLMRQLRDKEMTIQGSEMVQTDPSNIVDIKGKGKANPENGFADSFAEVPGMHALRLDQSDPLTMGSSTVHVRQVPSATKTDSILLETDDDRYWKEENAAYQHYWSHNSVHDNSQRHLEWDKLQEDWEKFEATSTGIKVVSNYPFQAHNPYLRLNPLLGDDGFRTLGERSTESLLKLEAAVQNDPRDSTRWYQLGVKQQENEREQNAILALQRATELNPSFLDAWLALAVSYTNEGDKFGAYNSIRSWLDNNTNYKREAIPSPNGQENGELMQQLMSLIRQTSDGAIDADLQTALGIVLNTSEDFVRAQDCFRTALSVRPNDWLLYNRVGATLANSGQAERAVWYYYQALALNPSYIRARFNLGISYINMKQYDEAAGHILDALALQETDTSSNDSRGITSSALWECLRTTCMQLQRMDLVALCDAHDLKGFRHAFLHQ